MYIHEVCKRGLSGGRRWRHVGLEGEREGAVFFGG